MHMHNQLMRDLNTKHGGCNSISVLAAAAGKDCLSLIPYVGTFCMVFGTAQSAVEWCIKLQVFNAAGLGKSIVGTRARMSTD